MEAMKMTLRHLRIFICVCEEGGMTKAAAKLLMTQPSVSQVVQELEEHYENRLFERLGRRLLLTPAGEELLRYARRQVQLDLQTESAMRAFAACHHLRIGASLTIGEVALVELLEALQTAAPELQVVSEIHNTAELEAMVLQDELDLALVEGEIRSPYLVEKPFMEDELVFVDSPQHGSKTVRTPEEAAAQRFFVREEGSGTRKLFEQEMKVHELSYTAAGIYNNAEGIKRAVEAGLGITVISRRSVERELKAGSLLRFEVPGISFKRSFRLLYHKDKYISPDLQKVMDVCMTLDSPACVR